MKFHALHYTFVSVLEHKVWVKIYEIVWNHALHKVWVKSLWNRVISCSALHICFRPGAKSTLKSLWNHVISCLALQICFRPRVCPALQVCSHHGLLKEKNQKKDYAKMGLRDYSGLTQKWGYGITGLQWDYGKVGLRDYDKMWDYGITVGLR